MTPFGGAREMRQLPAAAREVRATLRRFMAARGPGGETAGPARGQSTTTDFRPAAGRGERQSAGQARQVRAGRIAVEYAGGVRRFAPFAPGGKHDDAARGGRFRASGPAPRVERQATVRQL